MKLNAFYLPILMICSTTMSFTKNLTVPTKNYVDSVKTENAVQRLNNDYLLLDQTNTRTWRLQKKYFDKFDQSKLNEKK